MFKVTHDKLDYLMAICPAIIVPPYFDGPVFGDDYGVVPTTAAGEPIEITAASDVPIEFPKSPKVPELPVEVHHTQPFNESAAWEAVRALSRGA